MFGEHAERWVALAPSGEVGRQPRRLLVEAFIGDAFGDLRHLRKVRLAIRSRRGADRYKDDLRALDAEDPAAGTAALLRAGRTRLSSRFAQQGRDP